MTNEQNPGGRAQSGRRSFLKRLTGEAVQAAGTLAGTSSVVIRSANAAGEAAAVELGLAESADVAPAASTPSSPSVPPSPPALPIPASPAPNTATPPPPLRPLTARESELLSATAAVLAANSPDGAPHLTRAPFHWDGTTARMFGQLFGQRVANVERDSRISVLVDDSRGWLTLVGEATVVSGPSAAAEAAPLLARDHPDVPAEAAWARLNATADQAVIVLRPTRILSQPG